MAVQKNNAKNKGKSRAQNKVQVKPRNKINKQREIEQKKMKRRKSIFIMFIIITIIVCFCIYILVSPTFKIKKISIIGNEQLSEEKIQEIASIKKGDNIFLKIGKVLEVKLKQNGCIETTKIKKIYPDTIEIEITERKKQFQIKTEQGNYIYIDEQGYIIGYSTEKLNFSTIIGMEITENDAETEKRLNDKDLNKMENILQIREECRKIDVADKVTQIQVKSEYILNLEDEGTTINLGDGTNLKNRMYYVGAILKQETGNKGIIYVNGNLNEGFLPYFSAY